MSALLNADRSLFLWINRHAGGVGDYFFGWPTYLGEFYIFLPMLFLFLLIWDSEKVLPNFIKIAFCVLMAGLCNLILKELFDRARPWNHFYDAVDQGLVQVNYLFAIDTAESFPSGHTTAIFGMAVALHKIYGSKVWWIYLTALWISFTRIYCGAHFPLDVLAGIASGTFFGWLATQIYELPLLVKLRTRFF